MRKFRFLIITLVVFTLLLGISAPVMAGAHGKANGKAKYGEEPSCPPTTSPGCCVESFNPHGKNIPPAGWTTEPGTNPNSGRNPDGFYKLGGCGCSCSCQIFVTFEGNTGDLIGPFPCGITVKFTEAPGVEAVVKTMGSANGQASAVYAHIILPADPIVITYRNGAEVSRTTLCLVPPSPK